MHARTCEIFAEGKRYHWTMSVPPSDEQYDPSGFQPEQDMLGDQPSGGQSAQDSYQPYEPGNEYPAGMDGIPTVSRDVIPPKTPNQFHLILIGVLCVVVVAVVAIAITPFINREQVTTASSVPSVVPAAIPPATLPLTISPATVVEAIDLASQPTLGPTWDASDTDANSGYMDSQYFVTPCGVLVTALTSSYDYPGHGANSRLVGYEIATGAKAWTVSLQDATGLKDPSVYPDPPSYTSACEMVMTLHAMSTSDPTHASIMVDLATGRSSLLASGEDLSWCTALGPGTAACSADDVQIVDSAQGVISSYSLSGMYRYPFNGDIVVNSMAWSRTGYVDPATGGVVFGSDLSVNEGEGAFDDWVTYREAMLPGGFASGVAVRLEGKLENSTETCSLMAWDTAGDKGLWAAPVSLTCSMDSWVVAGPALIVADDDSEMWAFSLADGSLMWDKTANPFETAWSRANIGVNTDVQGLTEDFALFQDLADTQEIMRIATGDDVATPFPSERSTTLTMSPTMGYALGYGDAYVRTLSAYSLSGGTDPVWSVQLPEDSAGAWTFATGGTMYVVYGDSDGPTWVSPLIEQ